MTYAEAILTLKKRGLWRERDDGVLLGVGLVPALRLYDGGLRVGEYLLNADELEALAALLRGSGTDAGNMLI